MAVKPLKLNTPKPLTPKQKRNKKFAEGVNKAKTKVLKPTEKLNSKLRTPTYTDTQLNTMKQKVDTIIEEDGRITRQRKSTKI
jgi:hypothetical protein